MTHPIPIHLLLSLTKSQQHTLCIWMQLKAKFKAYPYFHNFTFKSFAEHIKLSETCLRKQLPIMEAMGLCRRLKNGVLYFVGINKLKNYLDEKGMPKISKCVPIPYCPGNKAKQLLEIRNAVIRFHLNRQQQTINKKNQIVKNCKTAFGKLSPKQVKMINRAGGISNFEKSLVGYLTLSNNSFGKLVGMSYATGRLIQKKLNEAGYIVSKAKRKLLMKHTDKGCKYFMQDCLMRGVKFIPGIGIVQQLSNRIALNAIVGVNIAGRGLFCLFAGDAPFLAKPVVNKPAKLLKLNMPQVT